MSAAPIKVLVIDDEPPIRKLLRMGLGTQGYEILEAQNGKAALILLAENPDLVILDLGLPDIEGHELLRTIRSRNERVPIVVLSSRGDEAGKVQALDLGADDYVTKPFGMDELLARMRAALRHQLQIHGERPVFHTGELSVDLVRRIVKVRDKEIKLSPKEYDLLRILVQYFQELPWDLPQKKDVQELDKESQFAAWVLVNGYDVNHFTASINSHGVPSLDDIEKTVTAAKASGVSMSPTARIKRWPSPWLEATNSPITAPTGARVTASLMPAQMLGRALGNWIFRRTWVGVAPMARTMRICSGSADLRPVTVFTITGKKVKATTKNISLCSPKPNHTRNSGAMTTFGTACAITSQGVSMRSTSRDAVMAAPAARPKTMAMTRPSPAAKVVIASWLSRYHHCSTMVTMTCDGAGRMKTGTLKSRTSPSHRANPMAPLSSGHSMPAARLPAPEAGVLTLAARSTSAIGWVVPTLIRRALPPSRNARGCAGRWK